ncbi:MAG: DUF881 domain-containing protein [Mycobacteriales bacterium]
METPAPTQARRVDGSMSLLVDMMTNSLDPSYADAAARRVGRRPAGSDADAGRPDVSAFRRLVAVTVLVAVGLVTGVAAAQVRQRSIRGNAVRAQLVADARRRTAESDQLAQQADRLRRQVTQQQQAVLRDSSRGAAVDRQLGALQLVAGADPVTGPGLVVRLDDAARSATAASGRGGQVGQGRVLDRDLQDAVNGLWVAGAEAIAINGLRLTALTAIRSAGEAILVDLRPISPPYEISAIGNPGRLDAGFADSAAGRRLTTYTSLYGIQLTVRQSNHEQLPGAGSQVLRFAIAGAPADTTRSAATSGATP